MRLIPRSHSGFTLAETLASIAIIGLTMAAAAPALGSLTRSGREAAILNQLVGSLHLARSTAITRNRTVSLCPSTDGSVCTGQRWEQGWIAFVDRDTDGERAPDEELLDAQPAVEGARIPGGEYASGLSYGPTGALAPRAGGHFRLCNAGAEIASRLVVLRGNGLPALHEADENDARSRCPAS